MHRIFSRIYHMLGHKQVLRADRTERLYQVSFQPQWNETRKQMKENRTIIKYMKKLSNRVLNNHWVGRKSKRRVKNYLESKEMGKNPLNLWKVAKRVERKLIAINTPKIRKIPNKQPDFTCQRS